MISDHLKPKECRRLIAAIHVKKYSIRNVDLTSRIKKVPHKPCNELLTDYNNNDEKTPMVVITYLALNNLMHLGYCIVSHQLFKNNNNKHLK